MADQRGPHQLNEAGSMCKHCGKDRVAGGFIGLCDSNVSQTGGRCTLCIYEHVLPVSSIGLA